MGAEVGKFEFAPVKLSYGLGVLPYFMLQSSMRESVKIKGSSQGSAESAMGGVSYPKINKKIVEIWIILSTFFTPLYKEWSLMPL
jgi:hypothetical protein